MWWILGHKTYLTYEKRLNLFHSTFTNLEKLSPAWPLMLHITYGIQIRHALVCWTLSIANKNRFIKNTIFANMELREYQEGTTCHRRVYARYTKEPTRRTPSRATIKATRTAARLGTHQYESIHSTAVDKYLSKSRPPPTYCVPLS